jgi:CBS domain-containing protein
MEAISMKMIKDIMSRDVEVVGPSATLTEVARKMKNQEIGVLPVCDGRKLQGMITDRDIVTRAVADNKDLNRTEANEVMTRDVQYCFEDQSVEDAAEIMQKKQIRRLVILDRSKNLSGILSLDELAPSGGRTSNLEKDPSDWVTGNERMTGAQSSYLKTLSEEADEKFDPDLTKAEASRRIEELQRKTGRGLDESKKAS